MKGEGENREKGVGDLKAWIMFFLSPELSKNTDHYSRKEWGLNMI